MRTYGIGSTKRPLAWLVLAAVLMAAAPAHALIVHPQDPGPEQPTLTPYDGIVGRWGYWGTSVAVGMPGWTATNYVLTTAHQSGGSGDSVWMDGKEYIIDWALSHNYDSTQTDTADLRLARLVDAYVPFYATLNHQSELAGGGMDFVLAGWGRTRGAEKQISGQTYAYAWGGSNSNNNGVNWGTNHVDSISREEWQTGKWHYYLKADFDALYEPDATEFEGVVAIYDSGGGWFYNAGTEQDPDWKLIALNGSTEGSLYEHAIFRDSSDPSQADPDWMRATRIISYASWVEDLLVDPAYTLGDADFNGIVDEDDLNILLASFGTASDAIWREGDFNFDGAVNDADLSLLLDNYDGTPPSPLPEPTTAILLASGALMMMRRRRRA